MSKKLTLEEFIIKARKIHEDKYDYSLVVYINYDTLICIICPIHGEFYQSPDNHLQGKGCKECGFIKRAKNKTIWTKEKCLEEAKQFNTKIAWRKFNKNLYQVAYINGWLEECCKHMEIVGNIQKRCIYVYEFKDINRYNYVYVGLTGNLKVRYQQHKKKGSLFEFCQKYNVVLPNYIQLSEYINKEKAVLLEENMLKQYINNGWKVINKVKTGSLGGGLNQKQREKEFIKKAKLKHDEYDYSEVEYINSKIYVWLIHKPCGYMFQQTPDNHLQGHGCPKCSGKMKYTKEDFEEKGKTIHNGEYDYSKSEYVNNTTKVLIIHKKCGFEFPQSPSNHLRGQGCPECGKKRSIEKRRKTK